MKNRILSIIAALITSVAAYSQVEEPRNILEIGFAGGMNLSQMDIYPTIRQTYNKGLNGGISLRYTSEKYFKMICAAQLEINFSQRGWEEDFDDKSGNSYKRTLSYVEVPFLAHLAFGKEPRGFQFFAPLIFTPRIRQVYREQVRIWNSGWFRSGVKDQSRQFLYRRTLLLWFERHLQ